ncbi:MAG: DUF3037 domain-containing protein [Muribaculaceae bacterium]|nr:DUF3037 domain-containing protein [Muribaculaceae bacterium]
MQEQNKYEYAILRYVPRVEREEFINVGLAMMCKQRRWIKAAVLLPEGKLRAMCPDTDREVLARQLQSFIDIAEGKREAGPVAQYPVEERFRWISAVKSSVIQTSRPHPGLCDDLDATFARLFTELVE